MVQCYYSCIIVTYYLIMKGEDMKNIDALGIADKILENPYITTGFIRRGQGLTQPEAEAVYQQIVNGKSREQLAAEVAEWLNA